MTSLKTIDFDKESYFDCAGKRFIKTESISFNRFKEMQKILLELGFSATFVDIYNNYQKMIEAYNKHDYFAMSIIAYKSMEGIKNLEDKDHPALRLAALFINEENEDVTKYNEAEMKAKIDCWASELEVFPFIALAISIHEDWLKIYLKAMEGGSVVPEKQES
jgi:hypothetical protein